MLVLGGAALGRRGAEGVWPCADPGPHGAGEEAPHSLVHEQGWGVGPRGLQVLHGVPLVDAALLGADAALVVAGPDQGHAPREVVVPPRHFAGLVKDLQGRPGRGGGEGQAWEAGCWVLPPTQGLLHAAGKAGREGPAGGDAQPAG